MGDVQPVKSADLVIVDDFMPTDFSPFRWIEYRHYLDRFDTVILSTEGWSRFVGPLSYEDALAASPIPEAMKWRVQRFAANTIERASLGYVTFLSNAAQALPWFRAAGVPFILQLYPGGAFQLNQQTSDSRLLELLESGLCRRVIATQTVTRDYLVETIGWPRDRVSFIYGGVLRPAIPFDFRLDKCFYPTDKDTLDICFVAIKYGHDLTAKGYEAFIAVALELIERGPENVRFHVVGTFSASDIPLPPWATERFTFHGRMTQHELAAFFRSMDVIVSINRPFALVPGGFDGFPTGGCVEAGLQGVLNCINDPLNLNLVLLPGEDFLLLNGDVSQAAEAVLDLLWDPARLYAFAERNHLAYRKHFDADRQLAARTTLLEAELAGHDA